MKPCCKSEEDLGDKVFKVIVAGGRDFANYNLLKAKCDGILSSKVKNGYNIVIISGTANGADKLGERYAKERGYEIERHPADWNKHGRRAGYIRNQEMAKVGNALIAFWNGRSSGTKWMVELAKEYDLATRIISY